MRELEPCGTYGAYQRHKRANEDACEPCQAARLRYERGYRAGSRNPPRKLKPCGTPAAYRRHLRHGEIACGPCLAAHNSVNP